jgi:signal transduction histidine kinase
MAGPSIILAQPLESLLGELVSRGYEVEMAADGYRVLELCPRVHPVAVIARVGLPGPEAPELVRRIKTLAPDCRVVVLGARRRDDAAALLRAGCDAALTSDPDPQYLLWTLGRVLLGGVVLSPELARGLAETLAESVHREREWARTLADRSRQAEELARAKAEFLGNVSHELRTPLTIIKGVASLLRRQEAPGDPTELMVEVERAADKLTAMVDNLLLLADMERGTLGLDTEPCDLAGLIREEAEAAAARYPAVSVEAMVPDSVPTEADAPRIREVLRHLLDNACRYSESGGSVSVRVRVAEEGVTVGVTDRGQGVGRSQVAAAFDEPFAPGEATLTKERAGLGLGLNLARNIVSLHGGILWAEPIPGGGSRVSFTLPPPRWIHPEASGSSDTSGASDRPAEPEAPATADSSS